MKMPTVMPKQTILYMVVILYDKYVLIHRANPGMYLYKIISICVEQQRIKLPTHWFSK